MGQAAGEGQQRETVAAREVRLFGLALQDEKLVTEQRILQEELGLGASQIEDEPEREGRLGQSRPAEVGGKFAGCLQAPTRLLAN